MIKKSNPNKALQKQIINTALGGITKIKPLIHRTRFSGKHGYDDVKEAIGELKIDDDYGKKATERKYTYKKKAYIRLNGGTAVFLFKTSAPYEDPSLGYLKPKCIMETSDSTPEFLSLINQKLPVLKVMSIEYAIDFFCKDSQAVNNLFFLLRRYTYIHHSKRMSMVGGEFNGWKEPRNINSVYKIHFRERDLKPKKPIFPGKYIKIKIYERGDDPMKRRLSSRNNKKGWLHKDTNRVRLEVTLNRKSGILKDNGIAALEEFLQGPQFQQIIFPKSLEPSPNRKLDQFRFVNFIDRPSSNLPKDYQDYNTKDALGNAECFMNEYFAAKKAGINVSREMEDTKALKGFKDRIIKATRRFDKNWVKRVNDLK